MTTDIKTTTKPFYNTTIPGDWEVQHFEDVADIDKESLSGSTSKDYEFDYISLSDVDSEDFKIETTRQIFANAPSRARRIVHNRDVLMSTVRPNLQGFSLINDDAKDLIASTGFAVITAKKCCNEFLFQYLFSSGISRQFYQLLVGSNYPAINSSDVRKLKLPIPPLPEQRAIAHLLGLMDTIINQNNQLIAQKELRKKWLMQNLLTGKKRLKGFGGEWKEVKLEYFIEDYNEKPAEGCNYEVLTSAKTGLMKQSDYYGNNRITNREDADYNVIPPDYLTYRSRSDDGLFTFNKNTLGITGLISGYYPVFTIKYGDIDFILMYCNFYRQKLTKYSIGTSQLVLSMNALKTAHFNLPTKEEQTAIAQVLQAADKEIQLLKSKTEKLREQKRGMMQVLLTGKKRLNN
ncbi:MAG: restriction endonuclease subunit S [Prolixibacteraceae bacterium]|nr:restriction endonuclease subunit S [Prolixibacteraceae bacterium]